ncbi:MAG: pyridoxamine 5'-phosphate oxidase [Acidimicrobiales bacterium]|jgi:hypothetical protein
MLTFGEFSDLRPDLAAVGRSLLYGHGRIALGFLATVTKDGGPRVHPICPLVTDRALYGFIVPGPKRDDLRRDGRFALHSETFPPPCHDDAFYATGRAVFVDDPQLRDTLTAQLLAERDLAEPWPGFASEELVEFRLDRCLITLTKPQENLPAGHTTWAH